MKKLKQLLYSSQFWIKFITIAILLFSIETLILGLWTVPIINYGISYMAEVTSLDILFSIGFALLFSFGTTIFMLSREFNKTGCAIETASGIAALFTMLCPICPVFFLSYFGLSASLVLFAPYFWWIRLAASVLALIGIIILWRKLNLRKLPPINKHEVFQKFTTLLIIVLLFNNQAMAMKMGEKFMGPQPGGKVEISGEFAKDIAALVTPAAIPFYGPELGLDYSNVNTINASIAKMSVLAPLQGSNPIVLTDAEMERYVKIGTEPLVTCEFCCGVKTLVREDGTPTCGCAHSIAMRGATAHLLRNYPELSNEEISYEIVRQKGLYFPKQMQKRMAEQLSGEVSDLTPDIKYLTKNLTESELKSLREKAKKSGFVPSGDTDMVGGC